MGGRHAAFAPDFRDATLYALYAPDPDGSGVWEHSRDRETDLMKRWLVRTRSYGTLGWLAVSSHDTEVQANQEWYKHVENHVECTVIDQFKREEN